MGSMQLLPNGNVFVGWGSNAEISEFDSNANLLFHALLHPDNELVMYRGFKYPWTATPHWPPKLVVYSAMCDVSRESPLFAYVSWNGATEVHSWRFYRSKSGRNGPWISFGSFFKRGFETRVKLGARDGPPLPRYVMVEALDRNAIVIGATVSKTFVPTEQIQTQCDETGCFNPARFDYSRQELNSIWLCPSQPQPGSMLFRLVIWVLSLETAVTVGMAMLEWKIETQAWRQAMIVLKD